MFAALILICAFTIYLYAHHNWNPLPAGTTIDLSLSSGPPRVLVPDVAGFDEGTARTLSEAAGLTVTTEQSQTAAPKRADTGSGA